MRRRAVIVVMALAAAILSAGSSLASDLKGHGGPIRSIAVSADGTRGLTASFDYSMIHWRLDSEEAVILHRFIGHDAAVNAVAFTPDERRAVTASDDGTVAFWDLASGKLLRRLEGHSSKVVGVAVSPDGRWAASAGWDRAVRLWDLEAMAPGPVFSAHDDNVNAVIFNAEGSALYSGGRDGTVRRWSVSDGADRVILRHGWGVNTLQMLPGDRLLVGAVDGSVMVLDADSGETRREFEKFEGPVVASTVSAEGDVAAVSGATGEIRIWETDGWQPVHTHDNPYGPVWAMAFAAGARSLYYAGLDDFVIDLPLDPVAPFEPAKGTYPRRFQVTDDMELGERMFRGRCSVCHTLTPNDANRAGPTLYRLFGRRAGSVPGYVYSDALRNSTIVWNEDTIERLFTIGPQHYTPGTKMPLQSINNAEERDALIAYLKQHTAGPPADSRSQVRQP